MWRRRGRTRSTARWSRPGSPGCCRRAQSFSKGIAPLLQGRHACRQWATTLHEQQPSLRFAHWLSSSGAGTGKLGLRLNVQLQVHGTRWRQRRVPHPWPNDGSRYAELQQTHSPGSAYHILCETHAQMHGVWYQQHAALQALLCKRCTGCKELQGYMPPCASRVALKKATAVLSAQAVL